MSKVYILEPKENETKPEFISRCMGNYGMRLLFKNDKVRAAVAYKIWEKKENAN